MNLAKEFRVPPRETAKEQADLFGSSLRETARLQTENEVLKEQIAELQATNDRLIASAGSKDGGAAVPFSTGREDFNSIAKVRAKALGIPLHDAMSDLSVARPELWAKHRLSKTG